MMAIGGAFTTLSSEPSRLLNDREGSFSGISRRLLCRPLRQPRAGTPTSRRSPSTAGRRHLPHAPQSALPKPHARALPKPAANTPPITNHPGGDYQTLSPLNPPTDQPPSRHLAWLPFRIEI